MPAKADRGFSLIEIVAVLALISILVGIAAVRIDAGQGFGDDRRAQVTAESGLAAATAVAATGVTTDNPTILGPHVPEVMFVAGASPATNPSMVSVSLDATREGFAAASRGANGDCWMAWRAYGAVDDGDPGTPEIPTILFVLGPSGVVSDCSGDAVVDVIDDIAGSTLVYNPATDGGTAWTRPFTLS